VVAFRRLKLKHRAHLQARSSERSTPLRPVMITAVRSCRSPHTPALRPLYRDRVRGHVFANNEVV
jgi:hypothetical protein